MSSMNDNSMNASSSAKKKDGKFLGDEDEEYLEIANSLLYEWRKDQALCDSNVFVLSDDTTLDLTEVPLRCESKARKYMRGKVLQKVSVHSILRKLVWLKKCFKKRKNLKRFYEVLDDADTTDLCESTISHENETILTSSNDSMEHDG